MSNVFIKNKISSSLKRLSYFPEICYKTIIGFFLYYFSYKKKLQSSSPVFIVGCPHSGTSIMVTLLDSHSNLYSIPYETYIFRDLNKFHIVYELKTFYKNCEKKNKKNWVEKTPAHLLKLDYILSFIPKAKIIIMMRDGRDVACSWKKRKGTFEYGIKQWVEWNNIGERYSNLENTKVVKLEDLQTNPQIILEKILNFIDLPYEEEMLNFHEQKRYYYANKIELREEGGEYNHRLIRNWQINQPIMKNTSRWKKEMSIEEKIIFKSIGQKSLEKYGYAVNINW